MYYNTNIRYMKVRKITWVEPLPSGVTLVEGMTFGMSSTGGAFETTAAPAPLFARLSLLIGTCLSLLKLKMSVEGHWIRLLSLPVVGQALAARSLRGTWVCPMNLTISEEGCYLLMPWITPRHAVQQQLLEGPRLFHLPRTPTQTCRTSSQASSSSVVQFALSSFLLASCFSGAFWNGSNYVFML